MKKLFLVAMLAGFVNMHAQEHINAILIILDDMNDYIGVMGGHPQVITPNIDRLAGEGVFFSNAHANAPICAPSRASFLSGLYPSTTGNFGFDDIAENPVLTNSKFIMEYAAENGFETYSTGKVFHNSSDDRSHIYGEKQDQGPFAWDGTNAIPHPSVHEPFRNVGLLNGSFAPLSDVPPGGWRNDYNASSAFMYQDENNRDKMCDELSADFVCQWIDKHEDLKSKGNDMPFFIAYGGMKPHTPHVVPQRFFDMYPLENVFIPEILKNDLADTYAYNFSSSGFNDYDSLLVSYSTEEEGLKRYVQSKLAAITYADSLVGVIYDKIRNSSFADNTVIILCGDNGFHMGEKFRLAKNTLWEESTRVPLIVNAPSSIAVEGGVVNHPVGLIDIYPTIKDLCGMTGDTRKSDLGADLDGHSLRPFLENPASATWDGPSVSLESVINPSSSLIAMQNYSVRSERYRYIHYPTGDEELYDHSLDYNEWKNLIFDPDYEGVVQEMRADLKALVPVVEFRDVDILPTLFFDDFESYEEGDDLLSLGYKPKSGEEMLSVVTVEDGNQFARSTSVNGSVVSFRKAVKDLTPGKRYFFEAKVRTASSISVGSWEAELPNTISGLECADWKWFSIPLIPDAESWSEGLQMNLFITSAQQMQLDVDSITFYAGDVNIRPLFGVGFQELLLGEEYRFEASTVPLNEKVSWSVINGTGTASVDSTGKVICLSSGSVQLVAALESYPDVKSVEDLMIWDKSVTPVITIEALNDEIIAGMPYQLTASLYPEIDLPILWSVDDESKAIIHKMTGFLLTKSPGTITVSAQLYGNEDVYAEMQLEIGSANAVAEEKESYFRIYPNPSCGNFYIDGDGAVPNYRVFDSSGRLLVSSTGEIVRLGNFPKGVYYLVIDKHNIEKLLLQ